MIDLAPTHLKTVRRLLAAHVPECEVRAFGSRVAWTAKNHSDLDLAVKGDSKLAPARLRQLREAFEESTLPFRIDLLDWHSISENFRSVIQKQFVVLQQPKAVTASPDASALKKKWRHVALSDVMDVKHGFAFPGENIRDKPPGDILVTPGNFAIGGGFKGDKFKYFDGAVPEDFVFHEGDLIVTMTDLSKQADTLGFPALVPKPTGARFLHNQRIGKVLIKRNAELDKRFLFYLLRTAAYRDEVLASATGTTVKHTSPGRILAFKADIPPLPEQKAIAQILGSLDDKIELNRKMNTTLEAMARALFQSWFVDFDPVRRNLDRAANSAAKRKLPSLGKVPAATFQALETCPPQAGTLAADFQALELDAHFPSAFQVTTFGLIPKGWEVGRLDDLLTLQRGFDLPTPERTHGKYPVMAASGPNGCHDKFMARGPGVTTGRSGVLGRVFFIHGDFWPLNTSLWVKEFKRVSPAYAFHLLRGLDFEMFNAGSAVPTLNRNHVHNLPVVMPPKEVIEAFDAQVMPLMRKQQSNEEQSQTLATLRDTLLPKLLNGELNVFQSNWRGI